jgi:hypothetical protein
VRLIHDCSRPQSLSLNSYAETDSFKYQTVDEAVKFLRPGYYMAKLDLQSAYRSVKLHPDCFAATGLKWQFAGHNQPTYMYDTKLPFGASCSPGIFHRLTQSVNRMMERRGFKTLSYLDDFLVITKDHATCQLLTSGL